MKNPKNLYFAENRLVFVGGGAEKAKGAAEKTERPKKVMHQDAKAFMKKLGLDKYFGTKYLKPPNVDRKRKTVTKVVKGKDGKPKKVKNMFDATVNKTVKRKETSKERDARVTKEVRIKRRRMCQGFLNERLKTQGYKTDSMNSDVMVKGTHKIDVPKYTNQLFTYLRKNKKTIIAEIKRERKKTALKKVAKKAPETVTRKTDPEKVTTFYENWEINRVKKFDSRINHGVLPKLVIKFVTQPPAGDASVRKVGSQKQRAKKFKTAVNKYLNKYGFYAKVEEELLQVKADAYCYDKNKLKKIKSKSRERQFHANFNREVRKNFLS